MGGEGPVGDDVTQFGRLLRQHRLRIGLTQRELADFSTISVRAIRDLEQGRAKRPRNDTVRLIADGLRLGPRARAALEIAANQGLSSRALKETYDAEPPRPPIPIDPIVGREPETAVICGELSSGAERLITVVGLAGVGKTRLALEVAARLHADAGFPVLWHAFPGAAADYRLAGVPEGLPGVIRGCADDLFGSGSGDGVQALAELVGDRPALLVIDGAGDRRPDGERLARLLHDCPELRLLLTADRPCGAPGERPFLLAPLEQPGRDDENDLDAFGRVASVRLFLDFAGRIEPGRPRPAVGTAAEAVLVGGICRMLDGLPGALRAAASWLLVYDLPTLHRCLEAGPDELLDHLAGAEGGSGLREGLVRCVRRLSPGDQALLAALCDNGGFFGLDDVVALTGLSLPDSGRLVRGLLLHGLVRTGHDAGLPPFRVLNLVRTLVRATAGRMPEQLPSGDLDRVSHGAREGALS